MLHGTGRTWSRRSYGQRTVAGRDRVRRRTCGALRRRLRRMRARAELPAFRKWLQRDCFSATFPSLFPITDPAISCRSISYTITRLTLLGDPATRDAASRFTMIEQSSNARLFLTHGSGDQASLRDGIAQRRRASVG